ncbi:MAG TPA: DUF2066 domain-containing protein [Stellaceae bacterium]|jgi:hypothetical protein|nr:DUF2066 domain-containing protein [Stellaceae bacterium]
MTLPLVSAGAAGRAGRCAAGAGLLLLVVMLGLGRAAADDQPDPYSATVKVDATADSAAAARTTARTEGQRRALDEVIQRLTGSTDLSKLPKLDDQTITNLVDSFEVADEKMSQVRYLADYTFHFRRSRIRQLLRNADIAFSDTPEKPVVVVPVLQDGDKLMLWDDPNPWRDAWNEAPTASGPTKLSLPLGGVGDLTAIDAEQARSGDAQALSDIAQHNGGDEALVALAAERRQDGRLAGLDISLKRYRLGQPGDSRTDSVDAHPGESDGDFFKRAVVAAVADIEHGAAPPADKEASLAVTVPIASLGDWVELQRRLAAVPGIRRVDLLSLSRQQAKVQIRYVGSPEALKSSLAQADLDLDGNEPDWRLVPAGGADQN